MCTYTKKINHSDNYSKFSYVTENRPINKSHVEKLIESIKKDNRMDFHPIIVDDNFRIFDGQHRFEACKKLGIPIKYIINNNPSIDCIIDDQICLIWTTKDWIHHYSKKNYYEYIKWNSLLEKYDIQHQFLININHVCCADQNKLMRLGIFKINKNTEKYLDSIKDFIKEIKSKYKENSKYKIIEKRDFIQAGMIFLKSHPDYFKTTFNYLSSYFDEIPNKASYEDYYDFLKNCANKCLAAKRDKLPTNNNKKKDSKIKQKKEIQDLLAS